MHKLETIILGLYDSARSRYVNTIERICNALGLNMRSPGNKIDTLMALIETRSHAGDWVFDVKGDVFGPDRQMAASSNLGTLLSFANPAKYCSYHTVDGVQEVSVPISVWGQSQHNGEAKALIELGLVADLILTHAEDGTLILSRIHVDVRPVIEKVMSDNNLPRLS